MHRTRWNPSYFSKKEFDYDNQIRGAGYKIYFLYQGIVVAMLFLISFFLLGPLERVKNKRYMGGFFLLIVITFIQAAYPSSFSWWIPFLLARTRECCSK